MTKGGEGIPPLGIARKKLGGIAPSTLFTTPAKLHCGFNGRGHPGRWIRSPPLEINDDEVARAVDMPIGYSGIKLSTPSR